jgi:hypothetical protein
MRRYLSRIAVVFDNYLKGASDGFVGADQFAKGAPVAFFHLNRRDSTFHNDEGTTGADADTQTTSLTFIPVYNWHLSHNSISTLKF